MVIAATTAYGFPMKKVKSKPDNPCHKLIEVRAENTTPFFQLASFDKVNWLQGDEDQDAFLFELTIEDLLKKAGMDSKNIMRITDNSSELKLMGKNTATLTMSDGHIERIQNFNSGEGVTQLILLRGNADGAKSGWISKVKIVDMSHLKKKKLLKFILDVSQSQEGKKFLGGCLKGRNIVFVKV
jgi:hypothetical protein